MRNEDEQHGETTPLLQSSVVEDSVTYQRPALIPDEAPRRELKLYILILTAVLIVLVDFGSYLGVAPQIQIFEDIVCDQYYRDTKVDVPAQKATSPLHQQEVLYRNGSSTAHDCSINPVQEEVALINQVLPTIEQIPTILLGIVYGTLADKVGRKPILLLSILGIILEDVVVKFICWFPNVFPLRLVWLSPLTRAIGGGDQVAASMIFTMIADVFPADERPSTFYVLTASVLVSDVVATPISAALMQRDPWLPWILSLGLLCLGPIVTLFLLTETLPKPSADDTNGGEDDNEENAENAQRGKADIPYRRLKEATKAITSSLRQAFKTQNTTLLVLVFFVAALGRSSTNFQLQYVRKRFGWSYARSSLMISLRGVVTLVLLLGILPVINQALSSRPHLSPQVKDLMISRGSAILLLLGSLLLALAPTAPLMITGVIVLASGSGFATHVRSLATSMVDPTHVGALYTAISVLTAGGALLAGPLLAATFRWGLEAGNAWMGMPFLVVGVFFAAGTAAVYAVRLQSSQEERPSQDVNEDA